MSGLKQAIERAGVKPEDLEKASSYQRKAGGAIEQVLVNMGSLSEDQLPFLYADALNEPLFDDDVVDDWQPSSLGYEPDHIEFLQTGVGYRSTRTKLGREYSVPMRLWIERWPNSSERSRSFSSGLYAVAISLIGYMLNIKPRFWKWGPINSAN